MEQSQPTPQPLTSRRAQQRSAVLAVIGAEPGATPPERDVPARAAEELPVPPPTPAPTPTPEAAEPTPAPAATPALPAESAAALPPPEPVAQPKVHPAKGERGPSLLSRLVHRTRRKPAVALRFRQPVPAHRPRRRWPLAAALLVLALPAAGWAAVYRFGASGLAVRAAASALPLRAGSINGQAVLLRDVYAALDRNMKLASSPLGASMAVATDRRSTFQDLVDQSLVRAELQARRIPVDAAQVTAAQDRISRGLGSSSNLSTWVSATYGLELPEFRESVVRPLLERQRLAAALAGDRSRYERAWTQADAASRLHGLVGMNDQGWLSASDLGPTVADAVASASRDTRTKPVPTPSGLAVFLYTERSAGDDGVTFWHVWQQLFPLDPVSDFLASARPSADADYYLP